MLLLLCLIVSNNTLRIILRKQLYLYFLSFLNIRVRRAVDSQTRLNSLVPGKFEWNFKHVICNKIFSYWWWRHFLWNCPDMNVTGLNWWSSTLAQVMAWCRQATSHYLSQCWPRSLSPYGIIRPQWVKLASSGQFSTIAVDELAAPGHQHICGLSLISPENLRAHRQRFKNDSLFMGS